MRIVIEKYNPEWKTKFEKESKLLTGVISESGIQIEHIGSTSVIGLGAKPIIDIMIGLKDFKTADNHIEAIVNLGYNYVKKYESIMPFRRFFTKGTVGNRTHHLHMVEINSEFWVRLLRFRNHLRENKEHRDKYLELKINLAKREWEDSNDFAEAKTEFIRRIEEKIKKSN